ncbi:MAG: Holliday junction resolvase RuvX [Patescibacteria group bacterium]
MKTLSIDYGTKNIGLALSDDSGRLGFPYKTLNNNENFFLELSNICNKEKVEKIIIGMPIGLSGRATVTTELVKNFIENLKNKINIDMETVDERLTTVEANKMENKNKRNIDELSAQVLLQSYLSEKI